MGILQRRHFVIILFFIFMSITSQCMGQDLKGSSYGQKYAIIIGVSNQKDPNLAEDCSYCKDDAYAVRATLIRYCNFLPDNIYLITGTQSTKSNIINSIQQVKNRISSDDLLVFYFSGHGFTGPGDFIPIDELDGKDEFIVTYDSSSTSYEYYIRDDELQQLLDSVNSRTTLCIFDSCYSGGMIKSINMMENDTNPSETFGIEFAKDIHSNKYTVLMASDDNEKSYYYPDLQSGLFTYYFLEGLKSFKSDKNSNLQVSAEEAFDYAKYYTTLRNNQQHPQIFDGNSFSDVDLYYLGVPTSSPTPTPTTAVPTTQPTTIPTTRPTTIPTTPPTTMPTASPSPSQSSGSTSVPAEFWGGVTVNGQPAPAGSVVIAKINGAEKGRITTSQAGVYGGSGTFDDRLRVLVNQNDLSSGTLVVTFWLNGVQAQQTAVFSSATSQNVPLTFSGNIQPTPTSPPPSQTTTIPTTVPTTLPTITPTQMPAPDAGTGALTVTSNPAGAMVYLDGVYKGTAPITITGISAGGVIHEVKVTKAGYQEYSTGIRVTKGKTMGITIGLRYSSSPVTTPSPVPTTIPPVPTTPPTTIPTTTPTAIPTTMVTTVPTPQPTRYPSTTPEEFWGRVTIKGEPAPSGSIIIAKVNGVERGRITTTQSGQYGGSGTFDERLRVSVSQSELSAGTLLVTFWLGGVQADQSITLSPAANTELSLNFNGNVEPMPTQTSLPTPTFTLNPTPGTTSTFGTLDVRSNPPGATVYLDDVHKGVSPTYFQVPVGTHVLKLTKQGYGDYSVNIMIPSPKKYTITVKLA